MSEVMQGVAEIAFTNWRQKGKMVVRKSAEMKISLRVAFLNSLEGFRKKWCARVTQEIRIRTTGRAKAMTTE